MRSTTKLRLTITALRTGSNSPASNSRPVRIGRSSTSKKPSSTRLNRTKKFDSNTPSAGDSTPSTSMWTHGSAPGTDAVTAAPRTSGSASNWRTNSARRSPKREASLRCSDSAALEGDSGPITSQAVKNSSAANPGPRMPDRTGPHLDEPCCMDHPEGCLIIVFFNTGDNLDAT